MDNQKWTSVLIEWVNCLQLCKNVQNIEELRNGDFFSNLQKVITKSRPAYPDILTFIFDLLGTHYPNYSFDNKTEIHLTDLPEHDLKAVTSLLMHYTCIFDRKDVLTSPLCHSLSQPTQLIIRNFLQKITKDVTNQSMENIIEICVDDTSDHSENHQRWLSVENHQNSPLQDLLKTPVSKFSRLHEKDRIIKKLKSDLETERYDKAELQQDLQLQVEKNKKYEQQLSQKANEIVRLRGDVAALENRTPPHYQDIDSRELQRRLRSEIQTLEKYIKQIEDEQEEIRKERDTANEQLRKLQSQSNIWEEKFFETERNFEILSEHSQRQEAEFVQLQEHCAELTTLLEEYRCKSSHDSSLYDTFVSVSEGKCLTETPSCEDLACSVIEVQLRDAQKQNEELKLKVSQAEEVKAQLQEAEEQLKKSEAQNEELTFKVKHLETVRQDLEEQFAKVDQNLNDAQQAIQEKTIQIEELAEKLRDVNKENEGLSSKVTSLRSSNEQLELRLNATSDELDAERRRCQILENQLDDLRIVSEKLQFELADAILNHQNLNDQLAGAQSAKENLLRDLARVEEICRVLETHIYESQQYSNSLEVERDELQRKCGQLDEEFDAYRSRAQQERAEVGLKIDELNEKRAVMETTNGELAATIKQLHGMVVDLRSDCELIRGRAEKVEEQLSAAYAEIQDEKQSVEKELNEIKRKLERAEQEKCDLVAQLRSSEESRGTLTKNNSELLVKNEGLQGQLLNASDCLEEAERKVEKLMESRAGLETQLRDVTKCLEEEVEKMRLENRKVQEELHDTKKILSCCRDKSDDLDKENSALALMVEGAEKELKQALQSCEDTREVVGEREKEIERLQQENASNLERVESQLEDEKLKISTLETRNKELTATIAKQGKRKIVVKSLVKNLQEQIKQVVTENRKLEDALGEKSRELQERISTMQEFANEMGDLMCEKDKLQDQLSNFETDFKQMKNDNIKVVEEIRKEVAVHESEKVALRGRVGELIKRLEETTSALEKVTKQKDDTEIARKELEANVQKEIAAAQQENQMLSSKNEELEESKSKMMKGKEDLQKELELIEERVQEYQNEKQTFISKIEGLEESKSKMMNETRNLMKEKEDLQKKLEVIKERVDEIQTEKSAVEDENKTFISKIEELEESKSKMITEKDDLQKELGLIKERVQDLKNEKQTLICKIERLEESKSKMMNETRNLMKEKEDLQKEMELIKERVDETQTEKSAIEDENKTFISKIEELEESKSKMITEKDDLQKELGLIKERVQDLNNEKQTLISKIERLEESRSKMMNESRNLMKGKEDLQKKLEVIKERMEEIQNEKSAVEDENKTFISKIEELEESKSKMITEKDDLQKERELIKERVQDLKNEKQTLISKIEKLEESKSKMLNETRNLMKEKEDLQKKLELIKELMEEIQNEKSAVENENQTLISKIDELERRIVDAEKDLDVMGEKVEEMEKEKATAEDQKRMLNAKIEDLEECYAVAEKKSQEGRFMLEKLTKEKSNIEVALTDALALRDGLQQELALTKAELEEKQNETRMLVAQIEELENCSAIAEEKSEEDKRQLQNEAKYTLGKFKEVVADVKEAMWSRVELQKDLKLMEVRLKEMQREKANAEDEKSMLMIKIEELEERYAIAEENKMQIQNETKDILEKVTKERDDIGTALKEAIESRGDLQRDLELMQVKVEEMQTAENDNRTLVAKIVELEEWYAIAEERSEEIKKQMRNETKDVLEKLTKERDNIQTALKEAIESRGKLQIDLEGMEREKATAEDEKRMLMIKIEELEERYAIAEENKMQIQNETKDTLERVRKERDDIEVALKEAIESRGELQRDLELMKVKVEEMQKEKATAENDSRTLVAKIAELEKCYAIAEEKSEAIKKQLQNETEDVLEKLTTDRDNIEVALKESMESLKLITGKVEESQKEKFAAENQNRVLLSRIEDLEKCLVDAEVGEQELQGARQELVVLQDKFDQMANENSILSKKVEVEEIISSENKERAKCLEETIQDYEITISGLKSVVDTNLERLESLKQEVKERKYKEIDAINLLANLLQASGIKCVPNEDLKTFIYENFARVLEAKNDEEKRREDLEEQFAAAQGLNSLVRSMVEKLQGLVTESGEVGSMETLKSCFDGIHTKVTQLLEDKQELTENLQKLEGERSELARQLEALKVEKDEELKAEREKLKQLKPVKAEKENILGVSVRGNKSKEEELKKENMMLKRKVVLTENAKNNVERVLKELREEKKKASAIPPTDDDALYKKLLQDYIQVKEENERVLKERDAKIDELSRQNEKLRANSVLVTTEDDKKLVQDLKNIREAYGNLMSVNSKLDLEMVTLRKIIDDRNAEVGNMAHIKEAYERLLEENNRFLTEIDTAKYKRMRDKEEFVRLLKKEREEATSRETRKIQQVRTEYEGKLEKMKDKMLKLYRDEVNKKVKSVKDGQTETAHLMKTVAALKSELFEADQKIQLLEMEREILKTNRRLDEAQGAPLVSMSSIASLTSNDDRSGTLPRSSTARGLVSQRTSIGGGLPEAMSTHHNLQMEDEEDLFNDKYLTDLKEGRCAPTSGRDSAYRFSELAWRNSMVPPHLKSSYPAETQFASPGRFKDDDMKTGNIEFEDSLCRLLPGEKPRKKDFGTTSYKRPGPPTPSKNGGRLSLQGNEIHPMREHCEAKTPKKSTPSRIRALFTGRNSSSTRDESQGNGTPSRGRRLNIFRRPR